MTAEQKSRPVVFNSGNFTSTPEQIRAYKRKAREYKRCAQGKPVNCGKCIGCQAKK